MTIKATTREDGTTDYYQWGLNCQQLKYTDAQCTDVLDSFKILDQELRDTFWHAFVNGDPRDLEPEEFQFAVYATQGGGFAKWNQERDCYTFVQAPPANVGFCTGDKVPDEWGTEPANRLARTTLPDFSNE